MTEKFNYCNDKGECTNKEWKMTDCIYSVCDVIDCVYLEIGSECTSQQAREDAGVK